MPCWCSSYFQCCSLNSHPSYSALTSLWALHTAHPWERNCPCSVWREVSVGMFSFGIPARSLQAVREVSGTTLVSLFKKIISIHRWLGLKIGLKKVSSALSSIQPWGMAAGLCGANVSSAFKGPRWEFVGGRAAIKHHCSRKLLADSRPSPSALWSNGIHQYGMERQVYHSGLGTRLWAGFPTASGVISGQDT